MNPKQTTLCLFVVLAACKPSSQLAANSDASRTDTALDANAGRIDTGQVDFDAPSGADVSVQEWPALPPCVHESYDGRRTSATHTVSVQNDTALAVRATLWRCPVADGTGESAIYRADRFELVFHGRTLRAVANEIFDYRNTHHNWADSARIEVDGYTIHWRGEFVFDGGLSFYVRVVRGLTEVLAETQLIER